MDFRARCTGRATTEYILHGFNGDVTGCRQDVLTRSPPAKPGATERHALLVRAAVLSPDEWMCPNTHACMPSFAAWFYLGDVYSNTYKAYTERSKIVTSTGLCESLNSVVHRTVQGWKLVHERSPCTFFKAKPGNRRRNLPT